MAQRKYQVSMKNAEASVRMEGCKVTPQMRKQCEQVLSGKTTTAECLKNALASARMAGCAVTEQTECDCERLSLGKVSVPEIVSEILNRPEQTDLPQTPKLKR